MLKVLRETFTKTAEESIAATPQKALGRTELQNLFRDDFAAHDVMVKSRRAGCAAETRMAA